VEQTKGNKRDKYRWFDSATISYFDLQQDTKVFKKFKVPKDSMFIKIEYTNVRKSDSSSDYQFPDYDQGYEDFSDDDWDYRLNQH
jgi:hypothetical protein